MNITRLDNKSVENITRLYNKSVENIRNLDNKSDISNLDNTLTKLTLTITSCYIIADIYRSPL